MKIFSRAALAAMMIAACGPAPIPSTDYLANSEHLSFRVSFDPIPPHAREKTTYKVVVKDKETNQPLDNGEGRIFASSRDRANTWDALIRGPEPGTYYATLRYVTAGDWAVAVQFRSDSTKPLERIDWTQEVHAERATTVTP